jgi:hypothetical protein
MKVLRLSSIFILACALMLTACASSDTTKVTIYFAKNGQASLEPQKLPLIDRILNIFTSKAYAQIHHTEDTDYFELYVLASDFGTYATAPNSATSISINVPSGDNRIFLLNSISLSGEINYAGKHVANLTGGDASFSINMYPNLLIITPDSQSTNQFIGLTWTYDSTTLTGFSTVEIYRACIGASCDGIFAPIGSNMLYAGVYTDTDNNSTNDLIPGNVYYYFLRINTGSFGGGGMPVPASIEDYYTNYMYYIFFDTLTSIQYIYAA